MLSQQHYNSGLFLHILELLLRQKTDPVVDWGILATLGHLVCREPYSGHLCLKRLRPHQARVLPT